MRNKGWYGNKQAHSLASRGIKVSESKKNFKGVPYHKNIAGVKFELRTTGRYWAKINVPVSLTEEDAIYLYYFWKEVVPKYEDYREGEDVKDFKKFVEDLYQDSYYYNIESKLSGMEYDRDDDEKWQDIKRKIDVQTGRNLEIIKELNSD